MTIIRAMRKSSLRRRGMRKMADRRRTTPALLAEDLDISQRDLNRVLDGDMPKYAPMHSLVPLGLLRRQRRKGRTELVITPLGLKVVELMPTFIGRR